MKIIPPLGRFEAHPVRLQIQDVLKRVSVGETITYTDISNAVDCDVMEYYHLLSYARDVLIDQGFVFDTVIGVGLKRVDSAGALAVAEGQGRRIANAAQRASRVMQQVEYEALSPAERIRFGLAQVRIGIVQQFNRVATARRVEKALQSGSTPAQLKASIAGSITQFQSAPDGASHG